MDGHRPPYFPALSCWVSLRPSQWAVTGGGPSGLAQPAAMIIAISKMDAEAPQRFLLRDAFGVH
jgi:hypothetical protein